ncbi:uncharacterized protein zgc:112982 isoform X1 [Brachionichthys hirsutus]|uniref:uncharacterized protein zgc:112982 isoform X1 n=1 Tax=Brachionichthys hirsutus TaxID=412623 RepID=UPI003605016A
MKEQYTPTPRSHSDFQPRESERGIGWRREEQDRGHGRVRDPSPSGRSEDQRGRRNTQGPNRDKQREDSHRERNLPFKRQRRQMDDRFRAEEDYVDQRYSVNSPRNSFGGDVDESLPYGGIRHSGPLVIEHDHGITRGGKGFDDPSDLGPDFAWQRSPCPKSSSTDRFRKLDSRLDDWEEARGHRLQDNWRATKNHASKRSMTSQVSTNSMGFGGQNGPMNHRERSGPLSASGIFSEGQGLKTEPHRSQSRLQQSSKGHQGPREGQKLETQPFRDEKPRGGAPRWVQEARSHWRHGRPGSPERHLFKSDIDPSVPCEKVRGWTDQKNTMVEMGETLTIKVDTSQPINKNSLRCYSSERQLSLDLVNVGRQRLDFLPMLEHSGTYHETTVHTGTFAQEIITLVHHVKEQYFRDGGISLNERFSAPPTQSFSEAPTEELTLDQRFSSNRGFSLKTNSLLDDEESLFSRLGSQQPVRGPGDLRHDLERKRQERLECVKVTIAGTRTFQAPPTPHRSSLVIG